MKPITKTWLFVALLLVLGNVAIADTVQVGSGTDHQYLLPIYTRQHYNYTQQIYTQEQIDRAGEIIALRFFYIGGNIPNSKDWKIYLGHSNRDSFVHLSNWELFANLNLVFDGDISPYIPEREHWMTIPLDTLFVYNNINNLVVAVYENTPGASNTIEWRSFESGYNTGIYYHSNTTIPNLYNPPACTGITDELAQIQFIFPNSGVALPPTLLSPAIGEEVFLDAKLNWEPTFGAGDSDYYDLYLGTTPDPPLFASNISEPSYKPLLQGGISYYWKVVAHNPLGASLASPTWNFDTTFEGVVYIGTGIHPGHGPFDTSCGYVRTAALYSQDQIGTYGHINSVSWSSQGGGSPVPYKIWMKCVEEDYFTASAWDNFIAGATLVKEGEYIFGTNGWNEFILDNPFLYNSGNLVIVVQSDTGETGAMGYPTIRYTSTLHLRNQSWKTDYFPPTTNGIVNHYVPNVALGISFPSGAPAFIISPDEYNYGTVTTGKSKSHSFQISNCGGSELIINNISITNNPTFSLADLPDLPCSLGALETMSFSVAFSPETLGEMQATISIVDNLGNRSEHLLQVSGQGTEYIFVGEQKLESYLPLAPYFAYNYSQIIYLQDEIEVQNRRIERLAYYWNGKGDGLCSNDWTIYMGHTTRSAFASSDDWIPIGELTEVYSGAPNIPASPGWIEIILDDPFVYDNIHNLVIALNEHKPGIDCDIQRFLSSNTPTARSMKTNPHYNPLNLEALPASNPVNAIANIRLLFGDIPDEPVLYFSPDSFHYGELNIGGSQTKSFRIKNQGSGSLIISELAISPDSGFTLEDMPSMPHVLQAQETLSLSVAFCPSQAGAATATLSFFDNQGNRYEHSVLLSGMAVNCISLGDGTCSMGLPVSTMIGHSYSQTIYLKSELNNPGERIERLAYFWNGFGLGNNSNSFTIYMGHTSQSAFASNTDWIPFSALQQVYVGQPELLRQAGWIELVLQNPFHYNNTDNLIIAAHESNPGGNEEGGTFYNTICTENRSLQKRGTSLIPDPAAPPAGMLVNAYPNTKLYFGDIPNTPVLAIQPLVLDFGIRAPNVPSPAQSILLMNQGLGILHLTEADISFWGTDASLFSADTSIFPLALAAGESASLELFFCPNSDGNKNASLRIAYAGENHDILLKGYALASGIVNIGNGSYLDTAYFGAFEPAVRFQVLYTSQELLAAGAIPGQAIEQLSFSLSCQTYRYLSNCLIRFKNTNSDVLTGFEGDAESFTTCFANSHLFSYSGWQYFNLETPYVWDGTGNLLLDISYICPGANLSVGAYSALAPNKVWYVHGNTDDAAALGGGGTRGNRIKTRFIFAPALESPPYCYIHPANYHFNDVYIGSSQSKTLSVINTGNSSLNITNISIAGDPAFSLGNLPNLPLTLASGHSFPLEVIYSPTALGVNNATVTLTDDQNTRYILGRSSSSAIRRREQNSRNTYTIALSGNCADYITIGEGTQDEHIPLNFYMGASLYETIFTNAELSGFEGMITGIKLYNSFATALSKPVQIWLGTTTQTNLAANWIPATELNLVYDDFIYFPAGANTIQINFTEPFMYQDCQNLVMMLKRPYEQMYNDYVSYFKCQTGAQNRARILYNDFVDYNAFNPPLSPTTGVYPRTTFLVIPGRVGHITGTVLGEDNEPLEGVTVLLAGREQSVQTDVQGQFCFPNLSPGEYSLSFSKFAYIDQSQLITLASDENTALNIFMQPMPRVSVSGNIVANDTGAGIEGAEIRLTGYDSYFTYSLANGSFSIPDVFAFETYDYLVSKAGYIPARGIVDLEGAASEMGDIVLNEIAYKPTSVSAHLSEADLRVLLSWEAPDPDAFELYESFEDTVFPPEAWSQIITNTGDANSLGVYPTWCQLGVVNIENDAASPTEGAWQAGLWWTISHQDEWLITPSFVCPPDARISFDTYASYGSQYGDHYYLKISLDNGASWIPLWDASVLPTGTNHYQYPVSVDLSNYAGNDLLLAFHALDPPAQTGLWHPWFIDNIYIGNMNYSIRFSEAELSRGKISRGAPKAVKSSTLSLNAQPDKSLNRALLGYKIWRLPTGQENNESTWVSLTQEPITHLNFVDSGWQSLNDGSYNWAVKAVYSANVLSAAAISNALVKAQHNGIVVGYVRRSNNQGIPAAMITASNGHSATTNNAGAYSMVLPVGEYSLTASANGYHPLTVDEVMITESQNVTVNFVLTPLANEDEIAPVLATALKGNYPNPFNPETTIYYEIKDAIPVCLEIYNLKGQKLRTLVNEVQAMGRYRIVFDGKDARKLPLPSGVYLYRFSAGEYRKMRKMILLQ